MTYSDAFLERQKFTELIGKPITVKDYQSVIVEEILIMPICLDGMQRIDLFWAVYKDEVSNKEYIENLINSDNEEKEVITEESKFDDVDVYLAYKVGEQYSDIKFLQLNYYLVGGY